MTQKELEARFELLQDSVIRQFQPHDSGSYEHWDNELDCLEEQVLSRSSSSETQALLASIRAQRVSIASEAGLLDQVLEQSDRFFSSCSNCTQAALVATLRSRALHATGEHEREIKETLDYLLRPDVGGSEYIFLLEELFRRHPGVSVTKEVEAKMTDAISVLTKQNEDFAGLSKGVVGQVEVIARSVASEIRRIHREKAQAILAES
jgi:hypothetical protein